MIRKFKLIIYLAFMILLTNQSNSEPFIVLEYRDLTEMIILCLLQTHFLMILIIL